MAIEHKDINIYRKLGNGLILILIIGLVLIFFFSKSEDEMFSKNDVNELLFQDHIILNDNFIIVSNKTSGIFDFSHKFVLNISEKDKKELINRVLLSKDYLGFNPEYVDIRAEKPRYSNDSIVYTLAYDNNKSYFFQYYKPRRRGSKPIWDIITISKNENILVFERILD